MIWPAESIWQQVMALAEPGLAGFSVEVVAEIDSTNSELMRRARQGALEPTLLIAEHQRAGRGRLGRSWESEPGDSLTFSLGLPLRPPRWEGLSLAVGVSLAASLNAALASHIPGERIHLKWPNDLWWRERKLAGILIETAGITAMDAGAEHHERYAVMGVGVNIRHKPASAGLRTPPAWLQEMDAQSTGPSALECMALPLICDVMRFQRSGFCAFAPSFAAYDALDGRAVILSDGQHGLAKGVDADGALVLHTPSGVRRVFGSEVSVRAQPRDFIGS